ncbi:MAG TPA: tRNA glutamyl-Q(34) synthetase GluQRS, partial [Beijerinckiaceae bacterium]|nr:tRNA glutamyl-Q(34) synthetase GluQRS [Beijerinckiaceae bacterium]
MSQPVFRFAPSPNGRLHLGHAYSALLNADLAARWGGRFLLRIEDIDVTRCRAEFEAAIHDDLAWLGLSWEPPVRRQSEHLDAYRAPAQTLKGRGVLYPCFCTRRQIAVAVAGKEQDAPWPRDPDGASLYPGTCRGLAGSEVARRVAAGEPHAWRLDMAAALRRAPGPQRIHRFALSGEQDTIAAQPARWGDAVIVRKEIPTSYHLSVTVDD